MPYDIFISYAHHDDSAHGNWVQQFHNKLADDFRSRTGKKLQIFLDREGLNAGNVLSDRLKGALNESAVFLPILSPAYLASPWCRREFLHFIEQSGEGLIIDGSCRIVPVQLMPYSHFEGESPEDKDEAARITRFLAEKEILYADFHNRPLPIRPDELLFTNKIAGLSEAVFKLLTTVRLAMQAPARAAAAPGGDKAIFLAYAAAGSKALREGLLKELQQQRKYGKIDYRILPDEAPDAPADVKALSAVEWEAFLNRQLDASIFSIHLFDDLEGVKTADTREPLAHLQYRLSKATVAARPGFCVFTADSVSEECSAAQEDFLKTVAGDARQMPQIETLPAFELKAIKDYLLEKIALIEEKTARQAESPAEGAPRRVFFVHDHRDKDDLLRNRIDDLIYEQQYDVFVPVFREDDPHIDPDASFRNFWLVCNKAVVLLRNASTAWCNAMKVELIKTATEKQPPYDMAICVTEPDTARRIREVRSHEFRIIDCTQTDYEQRIVEFLNAQRHA